jgi:hypothetical protein
LTANPEIARAINRHSRQIIQKGNVPTLADPVPAADREAISSRLAECHTLLTTLLPSERASLALALSRMLSGFKDPQTNVEMIITAYVESLSDLPFWAVEASIMDIRRGRVTGLSPEFAPTIARVYQLTETKLEGIRVEKARIERILNARVDGIRSPDSQETLRVAAKIKTFAADFASKTEEHGEKIDQKRKEREQRASERCHAMILAEYQAHGLQPIYVNGNPMSLSLARNIRADLRPLRESQMLEGAPKDGSGVAQTQSRQIER